MRRIIFFFLAVFWVENCFGVRAIQPRGPLSQDEQNTIQLFNRSSPAVVHITTLSFRRNFFSFNISKIPQGSGTGFIWDDQGHVVTNYHVIQDGDAANITLFDQTTYKAKLVGSAPEKDIAVLKIQAPRNILKTLPLGTSNDLKVGQKVFAIGNPFGLDQSLTTGIISALGREIDSAIETPIKGVIQTDAAINPGNSGGPLLDTAGRLIGVNTAIYSPSGAYAGIGFAIPVDTVNWVVSELVSNGYIIRPSLGATPAPDHIAWRLNIPGVLLLSVENGGAAFKAGLRGTRRTRKGGIELGDVIVRINGKDIGDSTALFSAVLGFQVGEEVEIQFIRAGKRYKTQVKLQRS